MERTAPNPSVGKTLGIILSALGFVGLVAGLLIFTARATWQDVYVLSFLIAGAALMLSGLLLHARVASVFAFAVGVLCLLLPLLTPRLKLTSASGMAVLAAGILLLAQGVFLNFAALAAALFSRRGGAGFSAVLGVLMVLFLLVVVNLISSRHYGRADLTGAQIFALSEKTKRTLDSLPANAEIRFIWVGAPGGGDPQLEALLEEYRLYASKRGTHAILEHKGPEDTEQLKLLLKQPPMLDSLILLYKDAGGQREKHLSYRDDMLEYPPVPPAMRNQVQPTFRGEEEITSALIALKENRQLKVYFTTGHGERDPDSTDAQQGISRAVDALRRDNYDPETVDLDKKRSIPADCALLVIAGPATPFTALEMDLVSDYLDHKGKLLVMLDPAIRDRQSSGLEPLLQKWGVRALTSFGVAGPVYLGRYPVGFDFRFGTNAYPAGEQGHPVVSSLAAKGLTTYFTLACPLQEITSPDARADAVTLVQSDKDAWGEKDTDQPEWAPGKGDLDGPLALVMAATEKDPTPPKPGPFGAPPPPSDFRGAKLVVFGDSELIVNAAASQVNVTLFVNSVNWLTEQENKLGIPPKVVQVGLVSYDDSTGRIILYLSVFGLPGAALVAGLVVYLIRRT